MHEHRRSYCLSLPLGAGVLAVFLAIGCTAEKPMVSNSGAIACGPHSTEPLSGVEAKAPKSAPIDLNTLDEDLMDSIAAESFSTTLERMDDFKQNYFRLVLGTYSYCPGQPGALRMIAVSRRFAKLMEEMENEIAGGERRKALLDSLARDVERVRRLKAEAEAQGLLLGLDYPSGSLMEGCYQPGYRMNAAELLIGRFTVREGLPLALDSFKARFGTLMLNTALTAYECDKILSAEPEAALPEGQERVRDEYLKWKAQVADKTVFEYARGAVPKLRSSSRPNESATSMGAPPSREAGWIEIEYPEDTTGGVMTIDFQQKFEHPLQKDIIEYAQRFVDAGR